MSRHNYTNPAFCQQSEFYQSTVADEHQLNELGNTNFIIGSPVTYYNKKSPITKVHRSESTRSFKHIRSSNNNNNNIVTNEENALKYNTNNNQQQQPPQSLKKFQISISNSKKEASQPPIPGPKPQHLQKNQNVTSRYEPITTTNNNNNNNTGNIKRNTNNNSSGRYALVPVEDIPMDSQSRYAVLPATENPLFRSLSTRFTKSEDNLEQFSTPTTASSESELTAGDRENEESFTSLPPISTITHSYNQHTSKKQIKSSLSNMKSQPSSSGPASSNLLKSAFSNDFTNNKSLILLDQKSMQRYEIVPTDDNEELVDANPEFIQMHNGRAHRYAVIPTITNGNGEATDQEDDDEFDDDDDDYGEEEETCLSNTSEMNNTLHNYATIQEKPQKQLNQQQSQQNHRHHHHHTQHQSPYKSTTTTTTMTTPAAVIPNMNSQNNTPQKRHQLLVQNVRSSTTPPSKQNAALATQKLHEILQTPRKNYNHVSKSNGSPSSAAAALDISMQQQRQYNTPNQQYLKYHHQQQQMISPNIVSSTPKQLNFTPQKLEYDQRSLQHHHHHQQQQQQRQPQHQQPQQQHQIDPRNTAIITPRLASLASSAVYTTAQHPSSIMNRRTSITSSWNRSWNNLSIKKTAKIYAGSLMLILTGAMNLALCLYIICDGYWHNNTSQNLRGKSIAPEIGALAGFAAAALGVIGYSRNSQWLPNRNYLYGYILVSIFSTCHCFGLLLLISLRPLPGTPSHDLPTGILLGLSALILILISMGMLTSKSCRPSSLMTGNRVDVY